MTLEHRDFKLIRQANISFLVITSLAIFTLGLYYYLPHPSDTTILGSSTSNNPQPTTYNQTPSATPSSTLKFTPTGN